MDFPTILGYGGIIVSVLWTAYQEIRFQISKYKQNVIKEHLLQAIAQK